MILNIAIGVVGLIVRSPEEYIKDKTTETLYHMTTIVQTGQMIINLAAVPRTFGIKFGIVALCLVLLARVLVIFIITIIPY